jgi:hypothetical protein
MSGKGKSRPVSGSPKQPDGARIQAGLDAAPPRGGMSEAGDWIARPSEQAEANAIPFGDPPAARDSYEDWLGDLEAAGSEATLFETLELRVPPKSKLERERLRGRLVKVLERKFKALGSRAKPTGVADAWLKNGVEPADLQGSAFVVDEVAP